jgi:hypothetical protein
MATIEQHIGDQLWNTVLPGMQEEPNRNRALFLQNEAQILRSYYRRAGGSSAAVAEGLDLLSEAATGLVDLFMGRSRMTDGIDLAAKARSKNTQAGLATVAEELLSGEDIHWSEILANALGVYMSWQGGSAFVEAAEEADRTFLSAQILAVEDRFWRVINLGGRGEDVTLEEVRQEAQSMNALMALLSGPGLSDTDRFIALAQANFLLIRLLILALLRQTGTSQD